MRGESNIEGFLQEQVKEGRRDSSGQFTLAREKALEKMSRYALPFEGAWLLKIVQSACRMESCSLIDIRLTRSSCIVKIQAQVSWSVEELHEALLETERPLTGSLQPLVLALRSLVGEGRTYELRSRRQNRSLRWSGEEFSLPDARSATGSDLLLEVKHRKQKPRWFFNPARAECAALTKLVRERACFSPVRLLLDGAEQSSSLHSFPPGVETLYGMTVVTDLPRWPLPHGDSRAEKRAVSLHVLVVWARGSLPCQVNWLEDGVLIGRDKIPVQNVCSELSVQVFLDCSKLAKDATTFQLRETKARDRAYKEAVLSAREALYRLEIPAVREGQLQSPVDSLRSAFDKLKV